MRLLLETSPIPGVTRRLPDGRVVVGSARFEATVFDPGEQVPAGRHTEFLSTWRRDSFTQPDGSMRVPIESTISGAVIHPAVIPAELLRHLPDDARLELSWYVTPGGAR